MNRKLIILSCVFMAMSGFSTVCQNKKTVISVDFSKIEEKIKPLHGVNNGPLVLGVNADLDIYHREAGFPYTRLHDPRWPNPDVVDIPVIFPDFDADPDDSTNYYFMKTDDYLIPIIRNKSEIIFRLGTSIEHHTQYFIHPPTDFEKWAKICVNIIRHYNDGWANGFHYNIKYWEIWNEPDLELMWLGTNEDYYNLYATAARAIKKYNPSLKVGGPATTGVRSSIVEPFLDFCRKNSLPLDFFSWHGYRNNPYQITADAEYIRELLDQYGFKETENHLNEWHYLTSWEELGPKKEELEKFKHLREKFAMTVGPIGAAYAASVLLLSQDSPIDVMNYYSADTNPYGMFDVFGAPSKVYYVFKAFNQLAGMETRVNCQFSSSDSTLACVAGVSASKEKAVLMISNYSSQQKDCRLSFKNFPGGAKTHYEIYQIDDKRDLELIENDQVDHGKLLNLELRPYAVTLLVLKGTEQGVSGGEH